jgi:hypothetical protein
MNYFCQLLNVQWVGVLGTQKYRQQTHLCESLAGADQIPAELIQVGGGLHCEIHKLINLIWNKEELPHQWKESNVIPIHTKGDKTDCSNY